VVLDEDHEVGFRDGAVEIVGARDCESWHIPLRA
jgi:hypothetical protein